MFLLSSEGLSHERRNKSQSSFPNWTFYFKKIWMTENLNRHSIERAPVCGAVAGLTQRRRKHFTAAESTVSQCWVCFRPFVNWTTIIGAECELAVTCWKAIMSFVKYREKHYFQISNVTIAIPPLDGVVYLLRPENEKKKKRSQQTFFFWWNCLCPHLYEVESSPVFSLNLQFFLVL